MLDEPVHRFLVEMVGHQVSQRVQPGLPDGREAGPRLRREVPPGQRGDLGQERPPEIVALQRAVPRRAEHGAHPAAARERPAGPVTRRTPWWIA